MLEMPKPVLQPEKDVLLDRLRGGAPHHGTVLTFRLKIPGPTCSGVICGLVIEPLLSFVDGTAHQQVSPIFHFFLSRLLPYHREVRHENICKLFQQVYYN
jgi:hypothetical protein